MSSRTSLPSGDLSMAKAMREAYVAGGGFLEEYVVMTRFSPGISG
jgi:hypothetical protein